MKWDKRPLAVTILAWVYIGVGTIGFVSDFAEFRREMRSNTTVSGSNSSGSQRLSVEHLCSAATTGRDGLRSPGSHSM